MTKFIKETLNKETLNEFLISHGVDTHDWGTGILKPIDALLKEYMKENLFLKKRKTAGWNASFTLVPMTCIIVTKITSLGN